MADDDDPQLRRIRERVSKQRPLRACLGELGHSSTRIDQDIRMLEKNGLSTIAKKAADGRWYVNVDDFISWVDQGMAPA